MSLPEEVIDVLRDHVEADGSLERSIEEFESLGAKPLYLPGGRTVKASDLARELRSWRPEPHRGGLVVYYATDPDTADFILENGVIPQMKPWTLPALEYAAGRYAEFAPGAGVERGLYVGGTPRSVEGFGSAVLSFDVPPDWIEVPAEMRALGYGPGDESFALTTEHGALIKHAIHPDNVSLV